MGAQRTESIEDAAQRLGLSTDAVRKRVRRGTIPAVKVDGRLRILVEVDEDKTEDNGVPDEDNGTPLARHVQDAGQDRDALLTALQDQIAQLKGQLAETSKEKAELRLLLKDALSKVPPALPAPSPGGEVIDISPPSPPRRPWWPWRRGR